MAWKKMNWAGLCAVRNAKFSRMITKYRAQDSINMVATVLYNLLASVEAPNASWTFLPWRMSRVTIMSVRVILSAKPIENNGMRKGSEVDVGIWWMKAMPIAG